MLLSFPADVLLAIFIIVIIFVVVFVVFLSFYSSRQGKSVMNEPEEIRKKSDNPDLPSEGQQSKPTNNLEE